MNNFIRTGLFAAIFSVLLLSFSSCKKDGGGSSSPSANFSFGWNGQSVKLSGVLDTGNSYTFTAAGVMPGSADTVIFNITVPNIPSRPAYTLTGIFCDTVTTSYNGTATFALVDPISGLAYQDQQATLHPFSLDITSNSGGVMDATFSGMVYRTNGTGADSLMLSNGHLSVHY